MKKFIVVPCKTDTAGFVVNDRPPYGYHHVIYVYPDDSEELMATVHNSVDIEQVMRIVSEINTDLDPVEIDPLHYRRV